RDMLHRCEPPMKLLGPEAREQRKPWREHEHREVEDRRNERHLPEPAPGESDRLSDVPRLLDALVAIARAIVHVYSGLKSGNKITSRIEGWFVSIIASRSMPMPNPAAGGMPC